MTARKNPTKTAGKRKVPTRVDEARAEMYRSLIFEAAEHAFGENGFENTTMQEIASATGISVKTLYASFPGKQELYEEIMLTRGEQMYEAVAAAQNSEIEPVEKLAAGLTAFVRFFFEHTSWTRIHVRSKGSWSLRPMEPRIAALWEKGQAADCKVLREGVEAGIFFDENPDEVARLIRAMTRVQAVRAIEIGEETAEAVAERLIRRVLRMICRNPEDASVEI